MAAIPTILKGDDSGAITLNIATGRTYTGATLVVAYQGVTRSFTNLTAGGTVSLAFTHDETAKMATGCKPLLMRLVGSTGAEETVENADARIKVTDCLAEVNAGGSFIVSPGEQGSSGGVPVTELGDVATRYTLADLQAKINEIVRVLAQRSLLTIALLLSSACCCPASASLVQHTCAVSNLWSDAQVVTNVSGTATDPDVVSNIVSGCIAGATNATLTSAKDYTDALIESSGSVTPQIVTSIVNGIVVDKRDMTNLVVYTKSVDPSGPWTWTSADGTLATRLNGCIPQYANGKWMTPAVSGYSVYQLSVPGCEDDISITFKYAVASIQRSDVRAAVATRPYTMLTDKLATTNDIALAGAGYGSTVSNIVDSYGYATTGEVASAKSITDSTVTALSETTATHTVTLSSHMSQLSQLSQSNTQLASSVSAISAHLNAEDAHFVSTNYDSSVRTPEAYVEVKVNGTWITIWREMTRWTEFVGTAFDWDTWAGFHTWGTNVTANITALWNTKADRCWGIYDSETGGYSPEGVTQISSSNILIAANMAYQRNITTDGAVWVLQCNNGHATLGGDTNGYFRIYDGTGTCQFEIIQGDQQELGADATGVATDTSTSPNTLRINYSVTADEHPTLKICNDLASANWKSETDEDCLANVTWTGTSGAYVAAVQAKTAQSKLFITATYMAGGETYINNRAPVSMSSIYLNGTKYYLGTATINGVTVLTLSTTAP